jgi:hypothetical protein
MRKLLPALATLLIASCGQGILPSRPKVSGAWGDPNGEKIEIHWYALEGADRYEIKGIDERGKATVLYGGTDTLAVLGERYPYYTVVAYAPSDIQESDTVKALPLEDTFTLRSHGSGFESAVCYNTDTTRKGKMSLCNPEDEDLQPSILLLLDSLNFVSPSRDTVKFGHLRILYSTGGADMAPLPPSGYADTFPIAVDETVAVWIDRGIADTFDLADNVLKVVVDSIYVGDGSRDSIHVWIKVRYQRIPRLRWY